MLLRWTAKLPALVIAGVLFIAGLFVSHSKWRYAALGGAVLLLAAVGFLTWSLTIKDWCAARDMPHSAFSSAFAPTFHQCLRMKGWLQL